MLRVRNGGNLGYNQILEHILKVMLELWSLKSEMPINTQTEMLIKQLDL